MRALTGPLTETIWTKTESLAGSADCVIQAPQFLWKERALVEVFSKMPPKVSKGNRVGLVSGPRRLNKVEASH